ncbi:tetratricopeptide repeat protein, partial [Actinokineospora sp. PR83]|uniref:tetratricopeptide repeat protein n=1 Tax=Actinokineospora sp. PR83 TaxID=2884908 RepID=UPI001F267BB3
TFDERPGKTVASRQARDRTGAGLAEAIRLVECGHSRFTALGHRPRQAMCLTNLCHLFEVQGDLSSAIECGERGLGIVAELGNPAAEAAAHENPGMLVRRTGDTARAEVHFERCLVLPEAAGFDRGTASALRLLAPVWADTGREEAAVEALERGALITGRIGDGPDEATTRRDLGDLLLAVGDVRRGTDELGAALALAQRGGGTPWPRRSGNCWQTPLRSTTAGTRMTTAPERRTAGRERHRGPAVPGVPGRTLSPVPGPSTPR